MKTADTIDDGIGSPDWKLSLCLLLAWILICAILMKGVRHFVFLCFIIANDILFLTSG